MGFPVTRPNPQGERTYNSPVHSSARNRHNCYLIEITYVMDFIWWKSPGHRDLASTFSAFFSNLYLFHSSSWFYLIIETSSTLNDVRSQKCPYRLWTSKQLSSGNIPINQHTACPLMMPEHNTLYTYQTITPCSQHKRQCKTFMDIIFFLQSKKKIL